MYNKYKNLFVELSQKISRYTDLFINIFKIKI